MDGRVVAVAEASDPFLARAAVKISMRMNPLGPWVLRGAIEGRMMRKWNFLQGLDARWLAGATKERLSADPHARQARFAMWLQSDELDDVVIAMLSSLVLKRSHCAAQSGERIGQGRRFGLLLAFASVDVYLPTSSRVGVRAGSDIIATLIHKEQLAVVPAAG